MDASYIVLNYFWTAREASQACVNKQRMQLLANLLLHLGTIYKEDRSVTVAGPLAHMTSRMRNRAPKKMTYSLIL